MGRAGNGATDADLMRRIAERLAGSPEAEKGLSGIAPLLSRYLKADLGLFLVQKGDEWLLAGHGGSEEFRRSLPRTLRLASRSGKVFLQRILRPAVPGAGAERAPSPDSVVVPVRAGRRSLGYGIFRTGAGRLPTTGTLRLLDAVGAQVAAFCEFVSRGKGDESTDRLERLTRSNRDLGWLLEFGESLHSLSDPDTMFKWLARELGAIVPILGLELVSLTGGPVIRIGTDFATKVSGRRDGAVVARDWTKTLSRYNVHIPEGDFRIKRFPCLPFEGAWDASLGAPDVRKIESPLYHAGRVIGILAVYVPSPPSDDRRVERLMDSIAGQLALFLHKHEDREKIQFLANHDALTGLLNHLSFKNIFEREFERHRRHERNMSLLFIDIDHFKRINDDCGHQMGDRVLREVAGILTASLRKTDYVFRYGGDEFVVLMPETDSERASMLAERIRAAVKREAGEIAPSRFRVSLSIGVADCSALSQAEREELLFRADGALYHAKNSGRDQVCIAISTVGRAVGVN